MRTCGLCRASLACARQPGLAGVVFVGVTEGQRVEVATPGSCEKGGPEGGGRGRAAAESPASGAPVPGGVESRL